MLAADYRLNWISNNFLSRFDEILLHVKRYRGKVDSLAELFRHPVCHRLTSPSPIIFFPGFSAHTRSFCEFPAQELSVNKQN